MRVLLIHLEAEFFGGAEKTLGYFLAGRADGSCQFSVAGVEGAKVMTVVPSDVETITLANNQRFSPFQFTRQVLQLRKHWRCAHFDLIHAWSARDWELASLAGKLAAAPVIGTLHHHPQASFLSRPRQRLMRNCSRWGLERLVAVSQAVLEACAQSGYPVAKLAVVHNGLPSSPPPTPKPASGPIRLGYLGSLSEVKGVGGLLAILAEVGQPSAPPWECFIAGGAQSAQDRRWLAELQSQFAQAPWWPRVHWLGWVDQPAQFLASLDCLLFTSLEFDALPTVLLEAGFLGVPTLASRVGGVPELIQSGETGWLFEPGDWAVSAKSLAGLLADRTRLSQAGQAALRHTRQHFTLDRMFAQYLQIYCAVAGKAAK